MIKFQGRSNGRTVEGNLLYHKISDSCLITKIRNFDGTFSVDPDSVRQFVGKDSLNQDIYEGDILSDESGSEFKVLIEPVLINEKSGLITTNFNLNSFTFKRKSENYISIKDVAQFILESLGQVSKYKLLFLCYYSQAWHLVRSGDRLFKEDFSVSEKSFLTCPTLINILSDKFMLMSVHDLIGESNRLSADQKDSINQVLKYYGTRSSSELRNQIESELPWQQAHEENSLVSTDSMKTFYFQLVNQD